MPWTNSWPTSGAATGDIDGEDADDAWERGRGLPTTDAVGWTLTDPLGTVRDIVRLDPTTGTVSLVGHFVYDAFGNVVSRVNPSAAGPNAGDPAAEAVDCLFGFTGRPRDAATGLQNNLHRWYDAETGRWIQPDWITFGGGDANLYRYCANSPTNATDPTGLRETDDRWTNLTKSLVDVSSILEGKVNAEIQRDWTTAYQTAQRRVTNPRWGSDYYIRVGAASLVHDVYLAFGADRSGTTVYGYGPVAKIGWLLDNQWLGTAPNQIFKMKFSQSRYLLNKNPWNRPAKNPWLFDESTRDHGLAPVIRIKGVLMGTDKWEHFFQQGYWLWDLAYGSAMGRLKKQYGGTTFPDFTQLAVRTAFSEWLEGTSKTQANVVDPLVAKYDAEFAMIARFFGIKGIYGSYSTGIISYADMCANEQGFQFYSGLYKTFLQNSTSPTAKFTFDVDNYDLYNMNEQNNPDRFVNGVIVSDGLDNTIPPMKRPPWVPPALPGPVKPPTW